MTGKKLSPFVILFRSTNTSVLLHFMSILSKMIYSYRLDYEMTITLSIFLAAE